ncbi:MAG: hypothetical protein AABX34_06695 [Nanoarchaeota archaeon]
MQRESLFQTLIVTVIASLILIAMGVVYFIFTLFIVKFSSGLIGYSPNPDMVILSSAVIVAGIMIGSAIKKG